MNEKNLEKLENNIRTQVHYEAEQTNRRLSWLGSLQGFLFASFGLIYTASSPIHKLFVFIIICSLGFLIALLILIEIYAGVNSIRRLREKHEKEGGNPKVSPEVYGYYPNNHPWTVYTAPEPLICFFIMIAWCLLFFAILKP